MIDQVSHELLALLAGLLTISLFFFHIVQQRNGQLTRKLQELELIAEQLAESKRAEDKFRLAASVFTRANEGIMITDPGGAIIDVNTAFTRLTGYSREEAIGQNPRFLSSGRHDFTFYESMWQALLTQGHWQSEVWNRRKTGEVYTEFLSVDAVHDAEGSVQHYVALFSDITAIKEKQARLEHFAHYDSLTGLPNRLLFADRLNLAIAQVERRGLQLALAYLDLDGFKAVNDQHGHALGDQLLIALAKRMKHVLRESDTIARLGGDEFAVILTDLPDVDASRPLLDRLLGVTEQPVQIDQFFLSVSVSIGVAFYQQADEIDADYLLHQADYAMYQAKLAGKNRYLIRHST